MKILVFTFFLLFAVRLSNSAHPDFDRVLQSFNGVNASVERGFQWLIEQRASNWGWGQDTARVIITLQLTNDSWMAKDNLQSQLSIKQLEIDALLDLWSRHHNNLRAGRLAQFVFALDSVCENPRSFHGLNLVSVLERMDFIHPFELGYVALALCNVDGKTPRKKVILSALHNNTDPDTVAMLTQALQCMSKQKGGHDFKNALHHPLKRMKRLQKEDGSFGNIHTTAVVVQALMSTSDQDNSWNATAAVKFILSQQLEDGSFGHNQWATTAVLPILAGRNYMDIPITSCHSEVPESTKSPSTLPDVGPPVTVILSLWIGGNISKNETIVVHMNYNASVYQIMKQAAKMDHRFVFTTDETSNGHYIKSIGGLHENTTTSHYWLFGTRQPDEDNTIKFADVGVDEFHPKDGENIVFWYKKI